jgi:hypothetical protein
MHNPEGGQRPVLRVGRVFARPRRRRPLLSGVLMLPWVFFFALEAEIAEALPFFEDRNVA